MQRYPYSAKDRAYTQSKKAMVPVPVYRRAVLPGQTMSVDATLRTHSAAINPSLGKIVKNCFWFYVPYRLLWDGWVDFITDPTGATSVPTHATPATELFETGTNNAVLARRAYKLIYNEYFGDENSGQGLYPVTTDGTTGFFKAAITLEQRFRDLLPSSQFTDDNYVAPVSGSDATINHSDFSRSAADARRNFRFQKSGDKYVDFLRTMGSNPDWKEQVAPEFLGMNSMDMMTRMQASTDTTNLGALRSYFAGNLKTGFRNKRFEEHGIVLGLSMLRPVIFNEGVVPQDAEQIQIDDFFTGDQVNKKINMTEIGGASQEMLVPPAWRYTSGQHIYNDNDQSSMQFNVSDTALAYRQKSQSFTPLEATLGTDSYAMFLDADVKGATPASTKLTF